MTNLIRKYHQTLMILITVLVIVAFTWLYNGTDFKRIGVDRAFRVYDRTLSEADIERSARRFQLARGLGLNELIFGLGGGGYNQNEALENFVWNSFVLDHEAKQFGIAPTDAEVIDAMKALQAFQTNGVFDPTKYQEFVQNMLTPNGFTDAQLEDLVRDDLRLKRLQTLVGTTVDVTPAEFRAAYVQNNQKMDVSLVRFDLATFANAITPTEEEITKYFNDHKTAFATEEKRVVSFVRIDLSDAEKALKGKEKMDARQKVSERAEDFGQALLDGKATPFAEIAKKQGLEAKTTPEFTEAAPAPELRSVPQAAAAAFRLTEKDPNSDALPVETGFCILHLDKIVPSRPLSLEEARPRVIEQIKNERGHDALVSKANETRAKIAEALKAGKSFADAVAEAGQKVESFPSFSVVEPVTDKPSSEEIIQKAVELGPNELSEFVSTDDGGLLVHLDKREPIDEAKFAKEQVTQLDGFRSRKRLAVFREWLQLHRKAANVQSLETKPGTRPS